MKLGQRSYSIIIENDLIQSLGDYLKNKNTNQKWVIISQNAIMNHYGNDLFLYRVFQFPKGVCK